MAGVRGMIAQRGTVNGGIVRDVRTSSRSYSRCCMYRICVNSKRCILQYVCLGSVEPGVMGRADEAP
jgi:hypothetical protein